MSSAIKRNLHRGFFIWGLLSLIFVSGFMAPAESKETLEMSQVNESYKNASLIAGNWIVGVHMNAVASEPNPTLYSRIPQEWKNGSVCARSTDISGRYTALIEYKIGDKWGGGLAELEYSNDYKAIVSKLNENNSGVAIHRGSCSAISEQFVPAFWNAKEFPIVSETGNVQLIVNLNAQRSQQVFARGTFGQTAYAANCTPIASGGIAFNFQCLLDVPKGLAGELKFEVWQVRSGIVGKPRSAMIILGAS